MVLTLEDGGNSSKKSRPNNNGSSASNDSLEVAIPTVKANMGIENLEMALIQAAELGTRLKRMFRNLALTHHPDKGGDPDRFKTICEIRDAIIPFMDNEKPSNSEKINLSKTLDQIINLGSQNCVLKLIEAILKEKPALTQRELIMPTIHTVKNSYEHKSFNPLDNRKHALEAKSNDDLQEQFKGQEGDHLKTCILKDFKEQIENTSDPEELKNLKNKLKGSAEFKVLQQGQGISSNIAQSIGKMVDRDLYQTSSVKALEKMFNQQEENIGPRQSNSI
tara:strand:- start:505 stop:1338 length:834 start_codon:yes stop_codon:yes gene_type:complete